MYRGAGRGDVGGPVLARPALLSLLRKDPPNPLVTSKERWTRVGVAGRSCTLLGGLQQGWAQHPSAPVHRWPSRPRVGAPALRRSRGSTGSARQVPAHRRRPPCSLSVVVDGAGHRRASGRDLDRRARGTPIAAATAVRSTWEASVQQHPSGRPLAAPEARGSQPRGSVHPKRQAARHPRA